MTYGIPPGVWCAHVIGDLAFLVAAALRAAARRLRVVAALRAALRRLRVRAAFLPAVSMM
jgi:hypothetical protein